MASKSMFYPCACGKTFKQFRLIQPHVQAEEVVYHCGLCIKESTEQRLRERQAVDQKRSFVQT